MKDAKEVDIADLLRQVQRLYRLGGVLCGLLMVLVLLLWTRQSDDNLTEYRLGEQEEELESKVRLYDLQILNLKSARDTHNTLINSHEARISEIERGDG